MRRLINLLLVCALLLSVCLSAGTADSTSGGGADIDWETLFNAGSGGTVEERMKEVYKQVEEESELSKTLKELEKRKEQMERLYPSYRFVECKVFYSDVVDGVYIKVLMRKKEDRKWTDRGRSTRTR